MVQQLTGLPALEQAIQGYPTIDDIDAIFSNIILNEAVANESELIEPKNVALRTARKIKLFPHLSILKMELNDNECTTLAGTITQISTNLNKIRGYKPTANNPTSPTQLLQQINTGFHTFNKQVREYQILILADDEVMEERANQQAKIINSGQEKINSTKNDLANLKLTPLHKLSKTRLFGTLCKLIFNYAIVIGLILGGIYLMQQFHLKTTTINSTAEWVAYYLPYIPYIPFMFVYYGILQFVSKNIRAAQHQRTNLQERSTFIDLTLIVTKNQDNIDKPTCDRILDISISNIKPIENTGYESTPDKGLGITDIIKLIKTIKG